MSIVVGGFGGALTTAGWGGGVGIGPWPPLDQIIDGPADLQKSQDGTATLQASSGGGILQESIGGGGSLTKLGGGAVLQKPTEED